MSVKEWAINAATSLIVATAALYLAYDRIDSVCSAQNRDSCCDLTSNRQKDSDLTTPTKQLRYIASSNDVPVLNMVDKQGNFYLPLGRESDNTNNVLKYVMLTRNRYPGSAYKTLALSTNIFTYVDGAFVPESDTL